MQFPETLEVQVTQDDIILGTPCSDRRCPIALAFERAIQLERLDVYVSVMFHSAHVVAEREGTLASYELPLSAGWFIEGFDSDEVVQPISFTARRR